jgi:hypothetical protein
VSRDLADDFAGEPGEVVRCAARIAVIGQLRCLPLELTLAVAGGGQRGAGQGRSQVGELPDEIGENPEHGGKVPAERHLVLAGPGHGPYLGQRPGDRAGPGGQIRQGTGDVVAPLPDRMLGRAAAGGGLVTWQQLAISCGILVPPRQRATRLAYGPAVCPLSG